MTGMATRKSTLSQVTFIRPSKASLTAIWTAFQTYRDSPAAPAPRARALSKFKPVVTSWATLSSRPFYWNAKTGLFALAVAKGDHSLQAVFRNDQFFCRDKISGDQAQAGLSAGYRLGHRGNVFLHGMAQGRGQGSGLQIRSSAQHAGHLLLAFRDQSFSTAFQHTEVLKQHGKASGAHGAGAHADQHFVQR